MRWIKAIDIFPQRPEEKVFRRKMGSRYHYFQQEFFLEKSILRNGEEIFYSDLEWLDEEAESDMEYALKEGAELWEEEYSCCRNILKTLVELKDLKDTYGKTEEYIERKEKQWRIAKNFLKDYQHKI